MNLSDIKVGDHVYVFSENGGYAVVLDVDSDKLWANRVRVKAITQCGSFQPKEEIQAKPEDLYEVPVYYRSEVERALQSLYNTHWYQNNNITKKEESKSFYPVVLTTKEMDWMTIQVFVKVFGGRSQIEECLIPVIILKELQKVTDTDYDLYLKLKQKFA